MSKDIVFVDETLRGRPDSDIFVTESTCVREVESRRRNPFEVEVRGDEMAFARNPIDNQPLYIHVNPFTRELIRGVFGDETRPDLDALVNSGFVSRWYQGWRASAPSDAPATIGVSCKEWNFGTSAQSYQPVDWLQNAIEANQPELIAPIMASMGLNPPNTWMSHAGALASRCIESSQLLNRKHVNFVACAMNLIDAGARVSNAQELINKAYTYTPTSTEKQKIARKANAQVGRFEYDKARIGSFMAAMILSDYQPMLNINGLLALVRQAQEQGVDWLQWKESLESAGLGTSHSILHLAVLKSQPAIAEGIVEILGLDCMQLRNGDGQTPLDMAVDLGHSQVEAILRSLLARTQAQNILNEILSTFEN